MLHYADGKDVTISVGPQNMRDWTRGTGGPVPLEQDTFSTVADGEGARFGRGSVYRVEKSTRWTAGAVESRTSSSSATASACRSCWASPA